ncbi:MAG TPA: AAA family ATPase [Methylibium sp.]|nr:AAA family ATPase [Methylibium sp.]
MGSIDIDGLRRWLGRDGTPVELIETHISWVLLAGALAYKLKKPVRLPFLDFSRPEQRRHFCEEELRVNRRFAPQVYLGLSRVTGSAAEPTLDGPGPALDHAVRMRRFPPGALLSEQALAGPLDPADLERLARDVAGWQAAAAAAPADSGWGGAAVHRMALATLDGLATQLPARADAIAMLRRWFAAQAERLAPRWAARRADDRVREGHGDLHLANLVRLDGALRPFDAIEFDPALRFIDLVDDVAFTAMDLEAHGQPAAAARFVNAWVEAGGDHASLPLWRHAIVYRALVRALVTGLRAPAVCRPAQADYLDLARREATAPPAPALLITHGLPGSGKSQVALRLVEQTGAIRLRSDVERKRLLGVGPLAATPPGGLAYGPDTTRRTYARLAGLARAALDAGWPVVVDAAFLKRDERRDFAALAASAGCPFAILHCHAPPAVLRERITARQTRGDDPSEAGLAVLATLTVLAEPLDADERRDAISVDTTAELDVAALAQRWLTGPSP